ncbi:23S rRNA (guanosine(2251)-2'-O)-methyltransferase RlmB [Desulfofalx alkaliphila]|uniref:23S rRNA (guanosine(2251)-2'-O)-methyltransferase RlmB n=1 Tax=Desulfofalx alkaliphila TaxID=105483 RepID=UPI0004E11E42|nr:23S rRNA (guanosine(2251)-2'-O)-methyltransferase RlmB [Desulfofalx alkaliphila]
MELNKSNWKIKYLRKLGRRQFRLKERKFIIEGVRFVEELLGSGWQVQSLFYSTKLLENSRGKKLLEQAKGRKIDCWQISENLFKELADTETPQGVLALVDMPCYDIQHILTASNPLLVVVDGVQDPGNLGTIIRSADAAAATGVITLKGTVDLYNPKTLRSTMGSIFHLPIITEQQPNETVNILKQKGIKIVVGEPRGGVDINQINLTQPVALVVGSEAKGAGTEITKAADLNATIPMPGNAESLNVSVACGVMLYEVVRQRL